MPQVWGSCWIAIQLLNLCGLQSPSWIVIQPSELRSAYLELMDSLISISLSVSIHPGGSRSIINPQIGLKAATQHHVDASFGPNMEQHRGELVTKSCKYSPT